MLYQIGSAKIGDKGLRLGPSSDLHDLRDDVRKDALMNKGLRLPMKKSITAFAHLFGRLP
jgi:hypothetical protein